MKNRLFLQALAALLAAQLFSSCTQEPMSGNNEYEEYTRGFINTFGLIDPKQDWNLAEKASVTVNVGDHADIVKVYADIDGKYYLMARYQDVTGSVTIPFVAPASATDLLVKIDGKKVKAKVGDTVSRNGVLSRAIATSSDTNVTVSVAENPLYFNVMQISPLLIPSNERWQDYVNGEGELRTNDYEDDNPLAYGLVPEGNTANYDNPLVVKDFWFGNVGSDGITIYPVFWNTSVTYHTIGLYYFTKDDAYVRPGTEGATMHTVDLFTDKNYNENGADRQVLLSTGNLDGNLSIWDNNALDVFKATYPDLNIQSGSDIATLLADKFIKDDYNNDVADVDPFGWNNTVYYFTDEVNNAILARLHEGPISLQGGGTYDGKDIIRVKVGLVDKSRPMIAAAGFDTTPDNLLAYELNQDKMGRSLGINVKVPSNMIFGLYLKRTDGSDIGRFYSQSQLNKAEYQDATEAIQNAWNPESSKGSVMTNAYYAATYRHQASGNQFFSFEDAAYAANEWDLNDLVFRLDGVYSTYSSDDNADEEVWFEKVVTSTSGGGGDGPGGGDPVIGGGGDEGDEAFEWRLAIEDLGSYDDFDFNDLVVGIKAVSTNTAPEGISYFAGEEAKTGDLTIVTFKALAAGGVLPVSLSYNGTVIESASGATEWHGWFGNGTIPHTTMINTGDYSAAGTEVSYLFKDFDLDAFLTKDAAVNSGFKVLVGDDTDGSIRVVQPEGAGNAPQMFLVPGNAWKWPTERTMISVAYENFINWVGDSETYKDWYKTPKGNVVNQ